MTASGTSRIPLHWQMLAAILLGALAGLLLNHMDLAPGHGVHVTLRDASGQQQVALPTPITVHQGQTEVAISIPAAAWQDALAALRAKGTDSTSVRPQRSR